MKLKVATHPRMLSAMEENERGVIVTILLRQNRELVAARVTKMKSSAAWNEPALPEMAFTLIFDVCCAAISSLSKDSL